MSVELDIPVWVLLKWSENRDGEGSGSDARVIGVYTDEGGVDARVSRIAKANPQYAMRKIGKGMFWRIGPDEDQGFFGDRPIMLEAQRWPK